jgi:hypothetical protein
MIWRVFAHPPRLEFPKVLRKGAFLAVDLVRKEIFRPLDGARTVPKSTLSPVPIPGAGGIKPSLTGG